MELLNQVSSTKAKAYSESCQTSKMKRFAKIVDGFLTLTIFAKHSS